MSLNNKLFGFAFFSLTVFSNFGLAQQGPAEVISADKIQIMKSFSGKYSLLECSFKKTINGVEDTKFKPCDSKIVELAYSAPADYYLNFYMFTSPQNDSKNILYYGRRAWVKHTGCLENGDTTLCYNVTPGAWAEDLKVNKASCLDGEQDTTSLIWTVKQNADNTVSLDFEENIHSVYCTMDPLYKSNIKNIMSLKLKK